MLTHKQAERPLKDVRKGYIVLPAELVWRWSIESPERTPGPNILLNFPSRQTDIADGLTDPASRNDAF